MRRKLFVVSFLIWRLLGAGAAYSRTVELGLNEALQMAFENDKGLKMTELDRGITRDSLRQAARSKGVTLALTHDSKYQKDQLTETSAHTYANSLVASYPLYTGGLLDGSIAKAKKLYDAASFDVASSASDLRRSVTEAFYTLMQARDMMNLYEESVFQLKSHAENVSALYEEGKVGRADQLNSEVNLSNVRQNLHKTENDYRTAVKNMNQLIGLPLDTELEIKEALDFEPFETSLEECLAAAVQNHPSLSKAHLQIGAARNDITIARSDTLPQATLSVTQDLGSQTWPGTDRNAFSVMIEVTYSFFDGGVASAKVAAAKKALAKAEFNFQDTQDSVSLNVEVNYEGMRTSAERIRDNASVVEKAAEACEIALARYQEGVGSNLDVIDSQEALIQARSNYTQALCDYNIYRARLDNAMGVF